MKKFVPLVIFIILYLVYVFFSYRSFGSTWDEKDVYVGGKLLNQQLLNFNFSIDTLNEKLIRRHSPADILPIYNHTYAMILFAFNTQQSIEKYHLLNLIFATSIFIFSFLFLNKYYKNGWYSILGPIFLVLNPRFFGDMPANPKDMPFAVVYFISIACIYLSRSAPNILQRILILGFIFGLATALRTLGFSLFVILFLYDLYTLKNKHSFKNFFYQEILFLLIIFIIVNLIIVITSPYLGSNYFKNIIDIIMSSSKYPWTGKVFFMGKSVNNMDLTILYLPVWLLISVPIFILFSTMASFFSLFLNRKNEIIIISILAIVINFIIYFIVQPKIYDGLRHYLFLLPFFSLLTAVFTIEILKSKVLKIKYLLITLIIINCTTVVVSEIKLFPYQYIYFNELTGGLRGGARYFESDYWNASFREAIVWLKQNKIEDNKKYTIYTCSESSSLLYYFSKNMKMVDHYDAADYAVCYTRYGTYKKVPGKILYIVKRDLIPLQYVIQVRK